MPSHVARSNLRRIVREYLEQELVYHDFCAALRNLLVSVLVEGGFKYQLSWRIKSLDSIREKVARNAPKGKTYQCLADVEDVAGIRIVFYLESDKRRFLPRLTRALTRSRLRREEHWRDSGYRATHVLAQLGRRRLALNEYRRFAGLKCEIQLTSALYNAWSEVEHDILYKRSPGVRALDEAAVGRLKSQLDEALTRCLEPASAILEAVASRARQRGRTRAESRPGRTR